MLHIIQITKGMKEKIFVTLVQAKISYQSRNHKEKANKLDFTIKIVCSLKAITKKERQARDWEKIFTIHISDKRLLSEYRKNLQLNNKTSNSIKSGQKI